MLGHSELQNQQKGRIHSWKQRGGVSVLDTPSFMGASQELRCVLHLSPLSLRGKIKTDTNYKMKNELSVTYATEL